MNYLIVPGLNNSGPSHWQTFWAKSLPNASRVYQRCWDKPQKEEWVETLDKTVKQLKGDTRFALAPVLGVDQDDGAYACHMPWEYETEEDAPFFVAEEALGRTAGIRLTGPDTRVLRQQAGTPVLTLRDFGKGKAVYLGGFAYSPAAARMLLELLLHLTGQEGKVAGIPDNPMTECAWFPGQHMLVAMNCADGPVDTCVSLPCGKVSIHLEAYQTVFKSV